MVGLALPLAVWAARQVGVRLRHPGQGPGAGAEVPPPGLGPCEEAACRDVVAHVVAGGDEETVLGGVTEGPVLAPGDVQEAREVGTHAVAVLKRRVLEAHGRPRLVGRVEDVSA